VNLFAKVEFFNPTGSVKDRTALSMIEDAEKNGKLKPNSVIVEPTSGNKGIGLASVCVAKGYKCILVMPESMSIARIKLISPYGAEVVLSPANLGMKGSIEKAEELAK
jgi:cysteine synthase A